MKNVKQGTASHGLSRRMMAFLLAFTMMLGLCPVVFAAGEITGSAGFMDGTSELSSGTTVKTGKPIAINVNAAFSDGYDLDNAEVRLYIGDMASENIIAIPNGGKVVGSTYIKDGIKYTVMKDNARNENYLLIQRLQEKVGGGFEDTVRPWKAGDTIVASLGANFDASAGNGKKWPVELVIGGTSYGKTEIVSSSSVSVKNTKTADKENIVLNSVSGETTLGQNIVYHLSAYACPQGDDLQADNDYDLEEGEMPVTKYTVTDKLEFPAGIYIPSGTRVEDALSGTYKLENTTTDSSGNITGVTISYTVESKDPTKQIPNLSQVITLKGDKVKVGQGFSSTTGLQIKNTISTEATNIDNVPIIASPVTVTTGVRRPTEAAYLDEEKEIVSIGDKYGTSNNRFSDPSGSYVVKGDYILYKLSFRNDGDTPISGATITDTLPAGMTVVDASEVQDAKGYLDNNYNNNEVQPTWVKGGTATTSVSGNKVTFSNISVGGHTTFEAYILAKVTDDKTATLTNTAKFPDNQEFTAKYEQKKTEPKLNLSKSVNPSEYVVGQSTPVTYTVTLKNEGSADASNVKLEDIFPSDLINVQSVSISNGATYTTTPVTGKTIYSYNNLTIGKGETVTLTITGNVKADTDDNSILNEAKASMNGDEKKATATIYKRNTASNVSITKVSNDTDGFVKAGDTISYTINVNTNGKTVYDTDPLYVIDTVPPQLTYANATFSGSGITVTEVTSENQPKFKLTGNGTATITLNFTVNSDASGSFANTALLDGGSNSTSEKVTVGQADDYTAVKSAKIFRDGEEVGTISAGEDKEIQAGDTIQFFIRVKNNTTDELTNFTLKDQLVGEYVAEHNQWQATASWGLVTNTPGFYPIHMTICGQSNGVTGYENNYIWNGTTPIDFINNSRDKDNTYNLKSNDTVINSHGESSFEFISVNSNDSGANVPIWYNSNFKIPAGGYIDLTYTVTTASTFDRGSNTSRVGDGTPSTVSYHVKSSTPTDPPIDPSTDPDATSAPTSVPTGPMPVLSIEKGAYSSAGIGENNRIYEMAYGSSADFGASWDSVGELIYGVTITNNSTIDYITTNATFIDFFPKDLGLKDQDGSGNVWSTSGSLTIDSVNLATIDVNGNVDYKDATWYEQSTLWTNNKDLVYPQNAVAIKVHNQGTNELKIPAGQSINIIYAMRPRTTLKTEILAEAGSGAFEFDPRHEMNTAYFTADKEFKNTDNTVVKVIADTADIIIRPKSERPGLTKKAYASLNVSEHSINMDTNRAEPGARLIWKLRIDNAVGAGDTMTGYKLTDTLPNGYRYIEEDAQNNIKENQYTNTANVTYPDNLTDEHFKTGKMIRHNSDGTIEDLDYVTPTVDGKKLIWQFPSTGYELEAGEWLEFTFITEPETAHTASGVYYNKAKLEVNGRFYEDTVSAGIAEDGGVVDGDSFALNSILTSSKISVSTGKDTAVGGTADNIANADEGATIEYTLEVKNESTTEGLKNFAIINRLPYEGDSGVIVSGSRGSQFAVTYEDTMTVKVYDTDGTTVLKEFNPDELKITTYSADSSKVFNETSEDWEKSYMEGWAENFDDSTKLIRIQLPENYIVPKGATVKVTYNAKVPSTGSDTDTTAWNSFAYHYDAEQSAATNMAAEPSAVGVTIPKSTKLTGSIKVKKVWATGLTDAASQTKTFYLSVYDNPYESGGNLISTKSITLTSKGGLETPVNADVLFDNLEYVAIGKSKNFYIYESDKNGVPIAQNYTSNGYAMCKGFYRTDKGSYSTIYDKNNSTNQKVTPTDANTVQYIYATDDNGSNRVEYVQEGQYCFWYKGLDAKRTTNSAIFTNLVKEEQKDTKKEIFGPYYADVATNFAAASSPKDGMAVDDLTTGVVTERNEDKTVKTRNERDDNADPNRVLKTTYDNGKEVSSSVQYDFDDGWGNDEGHTVSTGFRALITGGTGGETINKVMWDITSNPLQQDGVFVKLSEAEYSPFLTKMTGKGYGLEAVFNDGPTKYESKIYRITEGTSSSSLTSVDSFVDMSNNDEHDTGIDNEEGADLKANDDSISFEGNDDDFLNAGDDAMDAIVDLNEVQQPLHWKITDEVPAIALGKGASVNIGIIIDQIYDKNAIGDIVLNPTSTEAENATAAEKAKITNYGSQSDIPAFNVSGEYHDRVIESVLQPLAAGKEYQMGTSLFTGGEVLSITSDNDDVKHFMLCAGNYYDKEKKQYRNSITVSGDNVRVGSFQSSQTYSVVNKQPAPSIAVKIEGRVRLTFDLGGGELQKPRFLTILKGDGNGGFTKIPEIVDTTVDGVNSKGEPTTYNGTQLKVNYGSEAKPYIDITQTTGIVYITSTGSNINIKSIKVEAIPAN